MPLVVPEVNPHKVADRPRGIIANPGATVMTMIDALAVLHGAWELTGLVVTTFQAASGLGRAGISRLHDELDVVHGDRELGTRPGDVRRLVEHELGESVFPAPLVLNIIPFVGHHVGDGWTSEEVKVREETRKILDIPDLPVSATCVRVPVVSSHSVTIHATFARPGAGGRRRAGRSSRHRPSSCSTTPTSRSSRRRTTSSAPTPASPAASARPPSRPTTLDLFISGDNLRKGAALNMVQTAELVARELTSVAAGGGRGGTGRPAGPHRGWVTDVARDASQ